MTQRGDVYTHGHHDSVLRVHRWHTAENSACYLLHKLRPGDHVLDIGCGPGTITIGLADRAAPGRVVATDSMSPVLAEARELAVRLGTSNMSFVLADAYRLAFADASFDIVHTHQLLQHLTRSGGGAARDAAGVPARRTQSRCATSTTLP